MMNMLLWGKIVNFKHVFRIFLVFKKKIKEFMNLFRVAKTNI